MDNLILAAAIGKNNELGYDNRLIWKIPEDLMFYRNLTIHKNVIMGRRTFESMPSKALEKRNVFVLSSSRLDKMYDVNSFDDVNKLLSFIRMNPEDTFVVVGGAQIYDELLPYVDVMYLTEINDYANADTFFPYVDESEWDIETIYRHSNNCNYDNGDVSYVRNRYVRRRNR